MRHPPCQRKAAVPQWPPFPSGGSLQLALEVIRTGEELLLEERGMRRVAQRGREEGGTKGA